MADTIPWYVNLAGVTGGVLILFGFYRTSIGQWTNKSMWYELDNTVGALLLIYYQLHLQAYISVVLNIIWAVVAFRGVLSFAERYNVSVTKLSIKRRRKR